MADSTIKLLENLIDFCAIKNKVISKNIANVGTENYKRETVEFKSILVDNINSTFKTTEKRHIKPDPLVNPPFEISEKGSEEMLSGINNVDIDREMSELAENSLRFKFASKKIGDYYKGIQNVIRGGGRF